RALQRRRVPRAEAQVRPGRPRPDALPKGRDAPLTAVGAAVQPRPRDAERSRNRGWTAAPTRRPLGVLRRGGFRFDLCPGVAQRDRAVEDRRAGARQDRIDAEVTEALELEAIAGLRFAER